MAAAWPAHTDHTDDLREMLRRYRESGLDVIVVDQTSAEQVAGGFRCVKAIVPGTLPMTFGHHARRLRGLPRVRTVSQRLGYTAQPLRDDQINLDPHPFP
jgi:ribosomal protein S12 methylthiotransferase accessory factor